MFYFNIEVSLGNYFLIHDHFFALNVTLIIWS